MQSRPCPHDNPIKLPERTLPSDALRLLWRVTWVAEGSPYESWNWEARFLIVRDASSWLIASSGRAENACRNWLIFPSSAVRSPCGIGG